MCEVGSLSHISKLILEEDTGFLEDLPSMDEVRAIVFSMDRNSVAGLDGFMGKFFIIAWEIVAEDVHKVVLGFFGGYKVPRSVTATWVILIPEIAYLQDF